MRWGIFAITVICVAGCGSGRPKTVPISGKITIDGNPPGESGRLHFQAVKVAEGYVARPAGGSFDAEGNYRVMSWTPDDGLVPGHYTVTFMPGPNTKIPARYLQSATSGLEVDVPLDKSRIEFDIPLRTK